MPSNFFSGQKCVDMALCVLATGNGENQYLLHYCVQGALHTFSLSLCNKQGGRYCISHFTGTKREALGADLSNQNKQVENGGTGIHIYAWLMSLSLIYSFN